MRVECRFRKPQSPEDEARDILCGVILSHVPVVREKCSQSLLALRLLPPLRCEVLLLGYFVALYFVLVINVFQGLACLFQAATPV